MNLDLAGRVAIVTGGSRGIGKEIALVLAEEGADVAIVARDEQALAAAAQAIRSATGRAVLPVRCDTSSDDDVRNMAKTVAATLGGIDILVNAAARLGSSAGMYSRVADIEAEALHQEVDVKVMGYLRCIREALPFMRNRGAGRIVNISGLAARQTGSTIGSIRNVSVAALTKNVADELASDGITAVVVHPGFTRTERTPELVASFAEREHLAIDEAEQRLSERANVLGRFIDAREVAEIVAFLASPKATAVNGDAVVVGGGVRGPIYY